MEFCILVVCVLVALFIVRAFPALVYIVAMTVEAFLPRRWRRRD